MLVTRVLTHCQSGVIFRSLCKVGVYISCSSVFGAKYVKELLSTSDGSRCEYGYSYDAFYDGRRWCPSNSWTGMEVGKTG